MERGQLVGKCFDSEQLVGAGGRSRGRDHLDSKTVAVRALRRSALGVVLLAALVTTSGCEKGRVIDDAVQASIDAYPAVWGSTMPPDAIEQQRARVECMWEELDEGGADPAEELECFSRRIAAMGACEPSIPADQIASCVEDANRVCAASAEFDAAASACPGDS